MKLHIFLESEKDKPSNLMIAHEIVEMCREEGWVGEYRYRLDPTVIAKAILLQAESEDTE